MVKITLVSLLHSLGPRFPVYPTSLLLPLLDQHQGDVWLPAIKGTDVAALRQHGKGAAAQTLAPLTAGWCDFAASDVGATPELDALANGLLTEPTRIEANPLNSLVNEIEERLYLVNKSSKVPALISLLKAQDWPQVLVFISARDDADAVARKLAKAGIAVAALHGEKDQVVREQALADFKAGKVRVLVATDLMARGIHVEALPVVINLDLPANAPVYVHRIGRTARAGQKGLALSLVCHGEAETLAAIRTLTGRALPLEGLEGFPVTDQPASGEGKRAPRDKQANRRTQAKRSVKQFKGKA